MKVLGAELYIERRDTAHLLDIGTWYWAYERSDMGDYMFWFGPFYLSVFFEDPTNTRGHWNDPHEGKTYNDDSGYYPPP